MHLFKDNAAGVRSAYGFKPGKDGLYGGADGAKVAHAVFEVFTPFVIVPKVNDLDDFDDEHMVFHQIEQVPGQSSALIFRPLKYTADGRSYPSRNWLAIPLANIGAVEWKAK